MNAHHPSRSGHRDLRTTGDQVTLNFWLWLSGLLFSRSQICAILALLVMLVFSEESKSQRASSTSPQSQTVVAAIPRETAQPELPLKEKAANTVFAEASANKATAVNQPRSGSGGSSLLKRFVMFPLRLIKAIVGPFGEGGDSVADSNRGGVGEVIDSKILDDTAVAKRPGEMPGAFRKPTNVVKPAYPPLAAAKNVNGTVLVDVQIDPDGIVRKAAAVNGPSLLHQAALEAAVRWRFEPVGMDSDQRLVRLVFIFRPLSYVPASDESDYAPPYQMAVTWRAEVWSSQK